MRSFLAYLLGRRKYSVSPYGTHAEFLTASLNFLDKTRNLKQKLVMFEIGTGGLSSDIFQKAVRTKANCRLVSFENDANWSTIYTQEFATDPNWNLITSDHSSWSEVLARELSKLDDDDLTLAFIDSAPWESRTQALESLKEDCTLILFHDVDYFPALGAFGREIRPIVYKPKSYLKYGPLEKQHLGLRTYGDVFVSWKEAFPVSPGYFTGPPTLIASNRINVNDIPLPMDAIYFDGN
jgi:hypothetical protein